MPYVEGSEFTPKKESTIRYCHAATQTERENSHVDGIKNLITLVDSAICLSDDSPEQYLTGYTPSEEKAEQLNGGLASSPSSERGTERFDSSDARERLFRREYRERCIKNREDYQKFAPNTHETDNERKNLRIKASHILVKQHQEQAANWRHEAMKLKHIGEFSKATTADRNAVHHDQAAAELWQRLMVAHGGTEYEFTQPGSELGKVWWKQN